MAQDSDGIEESRNGSSSCKYILKVLSGTQSGVEVALTEGEYTIGSGQDDDLQFVDVCLKSGHARLQIEKDKILVAGGAGALFAQTGRTIEAGDDNWNELEPLEPVSIGSCLYAIGPVDANWAQVSEYLDRRHVSDTPQKKGATNSTGKTRRNRLQYSLVASAGLFVFLILNWLVIESFVSGDILMAETKTQDVAAVREALHRYPFGKAIEVREEVDGQIFATGYVETPAERRALQDVLNGLDRSVSVRIFVLESIRAQIVAAIESFDIDVEFVLSPKGEVTVDGTILADEKANRFLGYLREEMSGISSLETNIKTAATYFEDVKKLAKRSAIGDTVLMRLADERIEASGVLSTDRLDHWIGFLQAYARRYADFLPLTSYVQLVNEEGRIVEESSPTRVGSSDLPDETGTLDLDLEDIKSGAIKKEDVFINVNVPGGEGAGEANDSQTAAPPAQSMKEKGTGHTSKSNGGSKGVFASAIPATEDGLVKGLLALLWDPVSVAAQASAQAKDKLSLSGAGTRKTSDELEQSLAAQPGERAFVEAQDSVAEHVLQKKDKLPLSRAGTGKTSDELERSSLAAQPGEQASVEAQDAVAEHVLQKKDKLLVSHTGTRKTSDELEQSLAAQPEEKAFVEAQDAVAEKVLKKWDVRAVPSALSATDTQDRQIVTRRKYLPLIIRPQDDVGSCWTGSEVKIGDVGVILFWLDYLSMSTEASLFDLDQASQQLLLEAALNPGRLKSCAEMLAQSIDVPFDKMSHYLEETGRNPKFVRYLVRDFARPSLEIAGVMLQEKGRFIQMPDGRKLIEGSSADMTSRLISVGALGALLQSADSLSPIIYSDDLSWKVSD